MNKREPELNEYGSKAEFDEAWEKWRQTRDQNNESVKRSRENSRAKKIEHDKLCEERERENSELTVQVQKLREQVTVLTKVRRSSLFHPPPPVRTLVLHHGVLFRAHARTILDVRTHIASIAVATVALGPLTSRLFCRGVTAGNRCWYLMNPVR